MSVQVQHRRGTASAGASFIGAEGEFGYLTDQKRIVAHDGATPGGVPMARLDEVTSEVVRAIGNANFSFQITDRLVVPSAAFTAARTGTLPLASAVAAGRTISFLDALPAISGANVLQVARSGSDTINGATSFACAQPRGRWDFVSDGISKWSVAGVSAGGVAFSPTGSLGASSVQAALAELDDEKQPKDATLTALAGLTTTTFGRARLADASAAAQRSALNAQAALGFNPVEQGGGSGMIGNKVYIGWNTLLGALTGQVDATTLGRIWTDLGTLLTTGANGSIKFPNGFTLKWGALDPGAAADYVHVFPVAFPTACHAVFVSGSDAGLLPSIAHLAVDHGAIFPANFTVRRRYITDTGTVGAAPIVGWYLAIGE